MLRVKGYPQFQGITDIRACEARVVKSTELPFFYRLRPPDELHKNQMIFGAQIKIGGETRQDLKMPDVSI